MEAVLLTIIFCLLTGLLATCYKENRSSSFVYHTHDHWLELIYRIRADSIRVEDRKVYLCNYTLPYKLFPGLSTLRVLPLQFETGFWPALVVGDSARWGRDHRGSLLYWSICWECPIITSHRGTMISWQVLIHPTVRLSTVASEEYILILWS